MTNTNKKKYNQLGMPYGTANNRLRKIILFRLLQRIGEDCCFQCGEKILTCAELSIDHKIPWMDNNPELFWDLNNIAFSHLSCNVGTTRPRKNNKLGPNDTAWCADCSDYIHVSNFHYSKSGQSGLQDYCKEHKKNHR